MNAMLKPTELELHPLCTLFPRLSGAEFDSLRDDIRANGLRSPIVLHAGMILDGGNRYRACLAAGVAPKFVKFDGDNLVSFVLSANLHRRHMSAGQQAAIVASAQDWAKAQTVGNPSLTQKCNVAPLQTAADRAAESGASLRTQKMADKVARKAPELARQVAHGEISLPKAHEQVSHPIPKIVPRPQAAEPVATKAADPLDKAREHAKKQNALIRDLRDQLADRDAQIEALRGELQESRDNARELAESLEAYAKVDEGTEATAKELKRLGGLIRSLESTRDGYMTQCAELKRTIASKDRQIKRLERA